MARTISRRQFLRSMGAAALCAAVGTGAGESARRPNIIFVLADDMGLMDTPLYGSEYYETPNLRRLAQRGMLFTNAYAASPLCSPTRASIMTGRHPARLRITTPACHLPPLDPSKPLLADRAAAHQKMVTPQSRRFLPLEAYTIGEALQDGGYDTAFIGKWHLGLQEKYWPRNQGFRHDLGAPNPGPPSYFSPYRIKTLPDGPQGEYVTDRLTDEAIKYLDDRPDGPFALFLWHFAVHAPFQAKEQITRKYRTRSDPRGVQNCPVMASMLHSLDESVGRILDKVDELKIGDNTIIIFTSDNGGNMYDEVEGQPPTNNAPLRGGKGTIYEGGVREPCIVVWPRVVAGGSTSSQVISSVDFYPTLLAMAGIPKRPEHVIDGISIVPALTGRGPLSREAVFCHFPHYIPATQNLPGTSVRKGDWKLVRLYGEGPDRTNANELYNLSIDISETTNLADRFPNKVKELNHLIDEFTERTGALVPVKNPGYQGAEAGWTPSEQCERTAADGVLKLTSTGNDPSIRCVDVPIVSGPMAIRFRMRSELAGPADFYWTDSAVRRFTSKQRIRIDVVHDGSWREYEIPFTSRGLLRSLRIDPGSSSGIVEIDWVRLKRKYGVQLRSWDMKDDAAP